MLTEPGDLVELEVLLSWADSLEAADPAYRAELAELAELANDASTDGIPTAALPEDAQRGSSLRSREFAPGGRKRTSDGPPVAEHPAVVVIVSECDDPRSWLTAGRALGAVLLHAAAAGVMAQPLGQVTDFPAARLKLRAALNLTGTPQVALRLGYATTAATATATPRRPLAEVLTTAPDPASRATGAGPTVALDGSGHVTA